MIFFSRTADGEIDSRSWHGGERDPEDPERGVSRTMYLFDLAEYVHVNETHCLGDSLNAGLQELAGQDVTAPR